MNNRAPIVFWCGFLLLFSLSAAAEGAVKGRAFGSPVARGLNTRASTAEVDPWAMPGAPAAVENSHFYFTTQKDCGGQFNEGEAVHFTIKVKYKANHNDDWGQIQIISPTGKKDLLPLLIHLDVNPTIKQDWIPPMNVYGKYKAVWGALAGKDYETLTCEFTVMPHVRYAIQTDKGCGPGVSYFVGTSIPLKGMASHPADKAELWVSPPAGGHPFIVREWANLKSSDDLIAYYKPSAAGSSHLALKVFFSGAAYEKTCDFIVKEPAAMKAVTRAATEVQSTTALLQGTINPGGKDAEAYFMCCDYPSSPAYFGASPIQRIPANSGDQKITFHLTQLIPGTKYIYKVCVRSGNDKVEGECLNFTTVKPPPTPPTAPPIATTLTATDVTSTKAVLNGQVNANGLDTQVHFSCCAANSSAPDYFPSTPSVTIKGPTLQGVAIGVMNLKPKTKYKFAVVAQNSKGKTEGKCVEFMTK